MIEKSIEVEKLEYVHKIFGDFDSNAKIIEDEHNVRLITRDNEIKIIGDEFNVIMARNVVSGLLDILKKEGEITEHQVRYIMGAVSEGYAESLKDLGDDCICLNSQGKPIKPKTLGQKKYIELIKENTVTFGLGPAGTGKTYLAVAMAVTAFRNKQVNRIILTRPAVEAGEKLGFLPGDLQNKVDPYLRPLYDALYDMFGISTYQKHYENGNIEVAPLAYMRGRTLDDAFIILDEAQNTTPEQMKMFLTRLGFGSKSIITGDLTQTDLPQGKNSGLKEAVRILKNIPGIEFCHLDYRDVVRHHLVQKIIRAYEKYENKGENRTV